jgi:pimeloyl-ACP methyl ester carboxylesterase
VRGELRSSQLMFLTSYYQALQKTGFLDDGIPVALIGYSFGSCFAYDCAKYLKRVLNCEAVQVISISGLSVEAHHAFKRFDDGSYESMKHSVLQLLSANFGRVPSGFAKFIATQSDEAVDEILHVFHRGFNYSHTWVSNFASNTEVLDCDFLWIIGGDDPTTKDDGWKVLFIFLTALLIIQMIRIVCQTQGSSKK